ncbi:MAG: TRAP transporter small permease [Deltaproteobacteria bacterium]|nr:TRAP transporter small permease [Deltaproteobacteria bacterium]
MQNEQTVKRNLFRVAIDGLSDAAGYFSALAILLATLAIVHQVVIRYIFNRPTIWQIEFAIYLLMAATFIGAAYGLKENSHINIELISGLLPKRAKARLDLITSMISLAFCLYLTWKGGLMWWEAYEGGWHSSSLWSVPLAYPYAILPIGMGLTCLQYLVKICDQLKRMKSWIH